MPGLVPVLPLTAFSPACHFHNRGILVRDRAVRCPVQWSFRISGTQSLRSLNSQQQTERQTDEPWILPTLKVALQKAIWILLISWLNWNSIWTQAQFSQWVAIHPYKPFTIYLPVHRVSEPHNSLWGRLLIQFYRQDFVTASDLLAQGHMAEVGWKTHWVLVS